MPSDLPVVGWCLNGMDEWMDGWVGGQGPAGSLCFWLLVGSNRREGKSVCVSEGCWRPSWVRARAHGRSEGFGWSEGFVF
jgi:hypothetical protein